MAMWPRALHNPNRFASYGDDNLSTDDENGTTFLDDLANSSGAWLRGDGPDADIVVYGEHHTYRYYNGTWERIQDLIDDVLEENGDTRYGSE